MFNFDFDSIDDAWLEVFENRLQLALFVSYMEARRGGKRKTHDEHVFEVNAFENLELLRQDLLRKTYRPSRSTAHIITKPVIREIFAAPFRDRVVHHLIFDTVYDWWDARFIYDSYSCRVGKGTLFGVKRLAHHIQAVSQNYTRPVYVYKGDVQGYFMSLPRRELYQKVIWGLDQQFAGQKRSREYQLIKFLWYRTLMDNPIKGAIKKGDLSMWDKLPRNKSLFCQPPGQGIVIGNLTSQLVSNIYLDMLDRFVFYDLGYRHYGRYVDDFYIVVREEQLPQLKRDIGAIREFLRLKKLTLHPDKVFLQEAGHGVPFLGAVVYKGYIVPGRRLKNNFCQACDKVVMGIKNEDTVVSYLGHSMHINSATMVKKIFGRVGWDYVI